MAQSKLKRDTVSLHVGLIFSHSCFFFVEHVCRDTIYLQIQLLWQFISFPWQQLQEMLVCKNESKCKLWTSALQMASWWTVFVSNGLLVLAVTIFTSPLCDPFYSYISCVFYGDSDWFLKEHSWSVRSWKPALVQCVVVTEPSVLLAFTDRTKIAIDWPTIIRLKKRADTNQGY